MTDDDVWTQIELGAGRALPYRVLQFGDIRCNRTSWGIFVNGRYVPVLEEDDPAGLAVRACVQHSLLDPGENRQLAQLLPLPTRLGSRIKFSRLAALVPPSTTWSDFSQCATGHPDFSTAPRTAWRVPVSCECLDTCCSHLGEPDGIEVLVVGDAVWGWSGRGILV